MNSRQEELFKNIVAEHIESGKAVGSSFLVNKYNLDISSATARNDMAELEAQGLITQPHTSAGRIPSAKGYRYYIDNYLNKDIAIYEKDKKFIDKSASDLKQVVRAIAELADSAVIFASSKDNVYYTGISNLLSQPEFADFATIYNISEVVDHCDEIIPNIFDKITDLDITIGKHNYFSPHCSSIFVKTNQKLLGILSPIRMNYERNVALLNYAKQLIK